MPEVFTGSPKRFGPEMNVSEELWKIIKIAGGGRELHKVVYDNKSGQYGFVFDDGRYQYLFQEDQDPKVLEEVKKLKIQLDGAQEQITRCEPECGAAIARADVSKKNEMQAKKNEMEAIARAEVSEKKEMDARAQLKVALEKLKAAEEALEAEKKVRKSVQKELEVAKTARTHAEKKTSESEARVARVEQSKTDSQAAADNVEEGLRRKLAETQERVDRLKIRADTAEKGNKNLTKQVVEQKDMRIAAEQHAGDLEGMLEAALTSLRDKSEAEAKEIVETRIVSVQTEAICRSDAKMEEIATQTEESQEAVQGSDQSLFGTIRYDAIWGTFPDDGNERKLLYTFMRCGRSHSSICRDFRKMSIDPKTQAERVRYWSRHGWVVDGHIENSPQVVMKRRVGYVDERPELVRAIWASAPGC